MKLVETKIYDAFNREGLVGFLKLLNDRSKKRIFRFLLNIIAIPIGICILIIYPFFRIRLICLYSDRIGHYAWDTEYWLCMLDISTDKNKKKYKTLYYTVAGRPVCNTQLHRMWKRVIPIIPFPRIMDEVN